MQRIRLLLVVAALCLAVISPLASPAYAWGPTQNPCAYQYSCANAYPYPYQYANRYPYPYQYAKPYPYPNQYVNRYPYPYQYQYANRYPYGYQPPPPPPPYPYPYAYQPSPIYVVPYVSGVNTGYGNYGRCQLYSLHQVNCFVPNASNSPNVGSIQSEPAITIWGNCGPGQTMTQDKKYQCSKTGAGWFPL